MELAAPLADVSRAPTSPPPAPHPTHPPGCLTSLAGLILTFSLSEHAAPAPKRASSDALDASVHSHRTDTSGELELPASPDVPLLGGGSGSSSGKEGPRHRPNSGSAAGGVGEGSGTSEQAAEPLAPPPAPAPKRPAAELWEGVVFVLSSKG